MAKSDKKPIIIIELNEFNFELVKQVLTEHDLPSLSKIFNMKQSNYKTNDRYNSGYLEPWVQWVSVHTGVPAKTHQIKHLGDVPDLEYKSFWEKLSDLDITTGVWGVMNAARGQSPNNLFFFPDPWTFSEKAYPEKLNQFLDLPRYLAKNYRNLKIKTLITGGYALFKGLLSSGLFKTLFKEVLELRKNLKELGKHHYVYISWFDHLVTLLFCQLCRTHQPDVSMIFLNSIAHIQHHHWTDGEKTLTLPMIHGFKMIDKLLAKLLSAFPEHHFIMHNGLSQMNTNHEKPWVLYRQKDPLKCLINLGLKPIKVEQHMTHDGHAFFESEALRDAAYTTLKSIRIQKQPLFLVERNTFDSTKLFYQLAFTDKIEKDAAFEVDGKSYRFEDLFDTIVTRTGRHIPRGTVFSSEIHFPNHIFNHEFNQYIYHYYVPLEFPLQFEYLEDEAKACVQLS